MNDVCEDSENQHPARADAVERYQFGDVDPKYFPAVSPNLSDFEGLWHLIPDRSESLEDVLSALGIPLWKRVAMKKSVPKVSIKIEQNDDVPKRPLVDIVTLLPLGGKKGGVIPIDGSETRREDQDTGCTWRCTSLFHEGRLLQRREAVADAAETPARAVVRNLCIYDVRCVFQDDPMGRLDCAVQLFRFTVFDGVLDRFYSANRWFRWVSPPAN